MYAKRVVKQCRKILADASKALYSTHINTRLEIELTAMLFRFQTKLLGCFAGIIFFNMLEGIECISEKDFLKIMIFLIEISRQALCARALRRETRLTVYPALSVEEELYGSILTKK